MAAKRSRSASKSSRRDWRRLADSRSPAQQDDVKDSCSLLELRWVQRQAASPEKRTPSASPPLGTSIDSRHTCRKRSGAVGARTRQQRRAFQRRGARPRDSNQTWYFSGLVVEFHSDAHHQGHCGPPSLTQQRESGRVCGCVHNLNQLSSSRCEPAHIRVPARYSRRRLQPLLRRSRDVLSVAELKHRPPSCCARVRSECGRCPRHSPYRTPSRPELHRDGRQRLMRPSPDCRAIEFN